METLEKSFSEPKSDLYYEYNSENLNKLWSAALLTAIKDAILDIKTKRDLEEQKYEKNSSFTYFSTRSFFTVCDLANIDARTVRTIILNIIEYLKSGEIDDVLYKLLDDGTVAEMKRRFAV